jgi:hypothetical protein
MAVNEFVKSENLIFEIDNELIQIDSFGLYHSLINDMKPGCFRTALRGGHLLFPDIKMKTHSLENFVMLDEGYFSLEVKHINDNINKPEFKTFFPYGTTPLQAAKIVINAIKNPKKIKLIAPSAFNQTNDKTILVTNQFDQIFKIFVKNRRATFFRYIEKQI